jgi:hypothetical protein
VDGARLLAEMIRFNLISKFRKRLLIIRKFKRKNKFNKKTLIKLGGGRKRFYSYSRINKRKKKNRKIMINRLNHLKDGNKIQFKKYEAMFNYMLKFVYILFSNNMLHRHRYILLYKANI